MLAIRTLAAVWPATRAPAMPIASNVGRAMRTTKGAILAITIANFHHRPEIAAISSTQERTRKFTRNVAFLCHTFCAPDR